MRFTARLATLMLPLAVLGTEATPPWRCGWSAQPPLQFTVTQADASHVTGLDVEITRAVAQAAGRQVQFEERSWPEQLRAIASGACDLTFGAIQTPEAEAFARFSEPYRRMENAVFVRPPIAAGWAARMWVASSRWCGPNIFGSVSCGEGRRRWRRSARSSPIPRMPA